MPPKSQVSGFLLGVTFTLLVLCLIPDTSRHLTTCLFRLFFHAQYGDFVAVGQPPGCTITVDPYYALSRRGRERREQLATQTPDAFLMEMSREWGTTTVPDAALFENHPYEQWAALRVALVNTRFAGSEQPPTERVLRALRFVEHVRQKFPENGALWLGEGLLYAELGLDTAAIDMFEEAAKRPVWNDQPGIYRRLFELHRDDGFLPMDAAVIADGVVLPVSSLDWEASYRMDQMLADSIREGDSRRFVALMDLHWRLGNCDWRGTCRPNWLSRHANLKAGKAAAEQLDDWPPADDPGFRNCEEWELEPLALLQFADARVDAEILNTLVPPQRRISQSWRQYADQSDHIDRKLMPMVFAADACGHLALATIAACFSIVLLSAAFSRVSQFPIESEDRLRLRGWRLLVLIPLCAAIFANAVQYSLQPVGMSDQSGRALPTIILGLHICCFPSFLILGLLASFRKRRHHANLCLLGVILLFVLIQSAAWLHDTATELILTRARLPMTLEYHVDLALPIEVLR